MKKKIMGLALALAITFVGAVPAMAATVYYNGDAVYWNYGRTGGLWSFSEVQTSIYEHSATANSVSSGWKNPGVVAYAKDFIGTGTAYCYWNCR